MRLSSGSSARTRSADVGWWIAAALVALVAASAAAWFVADCGTTALAWDEGEYVLQALATADRLEVGSIARWPSIIRDQQHYGKPPLLVNLLAGWIVLVGPTRLMTALALSSFTIALALMAVAGALAGRLVGARGAFVTVLALSAMPVVGRITSEVFTEPLVLTLVLAMTAVLLWPVPRWGVGRSALLATAIGLGLLAKTTFPVLVAGPALVWLLAGSGDGGPSPARRIVTLLASGLGGLAVASVWYATNWYHAFHHVRSSVAFNVHPDLTPLQILSAWVRTLAFEAFGACVVLVLIGSVVALLLGRVERRLRLAALALLAAGLPVLLAGLVSPNVSARLQLPAAGALTVGATLVAGLPARRRWSRLVSVGLTCLVGIQWLVVQGAPVVWTALPSSQRATSRAARGLIRAMPPRPTGCPDPRPATAVVEAMEELGEQGLWPECRLVTNHGVLNVAILDVTSAARGVPARFGWATYFSWDDAAREAAVDQMLRSPTVIAALFPGRAIGGTHPVLNRFTDEVLDFVREPSSGYTVWRRVAPPDGAFTLFLLRNFDPDALPPLRPVAAELGGLMRVTGFAGDERGLIVEFRCLERTPRDLAVAARATPSARGDAGPPPPVLAVDAPMVPGTSAWRPGRHYLVRIPVEVDDRTLAHSVAISVFDPRRTASGWDALQRSDGEPGVWVALGQVTFAGLAAGTSPQ